MQFSIKARFAAFVPCVLLAGSLHACAQPPAPPMSQTAPQVAPKPDFTAHNAAWIGHGFLSTAATLETVPQMCAWMRDHQVDTIFVNLGRHDKGGVFGKGAAAVPHLKPFLAAFHDWEVANKYHFRLFGWLNGTLDETSERFLDLAQESVRHTMLDEVRRFCDPKFAGSYMVDMPRQFDGIQYDLEPSGMPGVPFDNLMLFMRELRETVGPGKLTSFTPHKFGDGNKGRYWWSSDLFYRMAPIVDVLCVMCYDTGMKEEAAYRAWMKEQTTGVLRAVSGQKWNDDAHPMPKNKSQIYIGFPGFPVNKWHDLKVETMNAAAQGTKDGIAELQAAHDPSLQFLAGGAVYLYTDGTGKDGYSSAQNWADFKSQWLGDEAKPASPTP